MTSNVKKMVAQATPRVFKTAWFAREAKKAGIADEDLCKAAKDLMAGKGDDLTGGVWKKRVNKNMHRSIVLARAGERWVFVYLYAKNDRENITDDELAGFKSLAEDYAKVKPKQLDELLAAKKLSEICKNDC